MQEQQERKIRCYTIGDNIVKFDDGIDFDSISCFMDAISIQIEKETFNNYLKLYWGSQGGSLSETLDLADFIHSLPPEIEIEFVINNDISSGGVFLLYEIATRCSFVLDDTLNVMLHTANRDTKTRDTLQNKSYTKSLEVWNNKYYEILKETGLSKKRLKKFKNGEDVYLTGYEFKGLFFKYINLCYEESKANQISFLEGELERLRGE